MKIQVTFNKIEFLKPYRYFIFAKMANQSSRTQISNYTETPQFANNILKFQSSEDLTVMACIVLDYTGKAEKAGQTLIFGKLIIKKQEYLQQIKEGQRFMSSRQFVQEKIDKKFIVGHVEIAISQQAVHVTNQFVDNINDFRLLDDKNDKKGEQNAWNIDIKIHCGIDFPPQSGYFIEVGWTQSFNSAFPKYLQSSKLIQNQMNPYWHENSSIRGPMARRCGFLNISIRDKDSNVIETTKFDIQKMIPFLAYHFEIQTSEQVLTFKPKIYVSFMLEAIPEKSFVEEICKFSVTSIEMDPLPQMNSKFFMTFSNNPIQKIQFKRIVISKAGSSEAKGMEQWRKQDDKYFISPILQIPISEAHSTEDQCVFNINLLKSNFIKPIYCYLFEISRAKKFTNIVEDMTASYQECVSVFKNSFYEQQKGFYIMKWQEKAIKKHGKVRCIVQINCHSTPKSQVSNLSVEHMKYSPLVQKWKSYSNDLHLMNKLSHKMEKEIQQRTNNIKNKGPLITSMRKAEAQLQSRRKYLANKIIKEQQISGLVQELEEKVNLKQLERALICKAEELDMKYKANQEMRIRLQSLDFESPQLDIEELETVAVQNSKLLQQQQEKIQKIPLYRQIIKRQHDTIAKLEKLFEKRQIDKEMNLILNKELKKFEQLKAAKKSNFKHNELTLEEYRLKRIYQHIKNQKQNGSGSFSKIAELKNKIDIAEDELRRKSQYYANQIMRHKF